MNERQKTQSSKSFLNEIKFTFSDVYLSSIKIEKMSLSEYETLQINYNFVESPFGSLLVASTSKGICHMAFIDDEDKALDGLAKQFPKAFIQKKIDDFQKSVSFVFQHNWDKIDGIKLHLKGTDFQLKVWEALLKIPMGRLSTYADIALQIGNPKASRAVGTAIGSNPVAFLVPCHRVVRTSGEIGGYMWGTARKSAIIDWESKR